MVEIFAWIVRLGREEPLSGRCQEQQREHRDGGNEGSVSRDWHKDVLRSCRERSSQHLEIHCFLKTPSVDHLVVFSHITVQEFSS